MYVIVFDENGYYIDAHEATLLDAVADHNSHKYERAFKVTLRKTEKERIIHFIANCPVDQIHYGHESDIISNLYVTRGSQMETAYWCGQVSRGSAGEYQADERAGVARLSWGVSGR